MKVSLSSGLSLFRRGDRHYVSDDVDNIEQTAEEHLCKYRQRQQLCCKEKIEYDHHADDA
jgi:hypothetical protein